MPQQNISVAALSADKILPDVHQSAVSALMPVYPNMQ